MPLSLWGDDGAFGGFYFGPKEAEITKSASRWRIVAKTGSHACACTVEVGTTQGRGIEKASRWSGGYLKSAVITSFGLNEMSYLGVPFMPSPT